MYDFVSINVYATIDNEIFGFASISLIILYNYRKLTWFRGGLLLRESHQWFGSCTTSFIIIITYRNRRSIGTIKYDKLLSILKPVSVSPSVTESLIAVRNLLGSLMFN